MKNSSPLDVQRGKRSGEDVKEKINSHYPGGKRSGEKKEEGRNEGEGEKEEEATDKAWAVYCGSVGESPHLATYSATSV